MKNNMKSIISLLLVCMFMIQLFPISSAAVNSDEVSAPNDYEESAPIGNSSTNDSKDNLFVMGEIEELREETVKNFRLSDGSFVAVQYNLPVHFQDSENNWQEINGSLVEDGNMYVSKNGSVSLAFPSALTDNHLFDISVGDYSLYVSLYEDNNNNEATPAPTKELATSESESVAPENTSDTQSSEVTTTHEQVTTNIESVSEISSDETSDENSLAAQNSTALDAMAPNSINNSFSDSLESIPSETISAKAEVKNIPATTINPSAEKVSFNEISSLTQAYSEIKYPEALPNVDLIYQNYGYSIKESILIKQSQDDYNYSFLIECCDVEPELLEDGSVVFLDSKGNTVFNIPAPYMIDAAGEFSLNAKYSLEKVKEGWLLSVTADAEWMNDSNRVYPIALDPSVTAHPNGLLCTMPVTYVAEGAPSTSHNKPPTIAVGYGGSSTKQLQSFIGLPSFPYFTYHAAIISAELRLTQNYYSGSSIPTTYIGAHQVTSAPGNSDYQAWFQSMTWNTKPSYSSETLDYAKVSGNTYTFSLDITRAVKGWYNDSSTTRAIALISEDTSLYSGNYSGASYIYGDSGSFLYSANEPTLIITYRNDIGLEEYYTYQSFDVGEAGTAYISDHTGDLTVVTPLVSFASSCNPFELDLIHIGAKNNLVTVPTLGLKTKLGSGMTLNIIQKVTVGDYQAIYTDGDGTTHYFNKASGSNYYYDEDGLGRKIQVQDQWHTIMTDDHGNQWTFMNGYLALIQDGNGNQYEIHYIRGDGDTWNWHL